MNFSELVSDWTNESKERLTAVYRRSIEILGDEMSTTDRQGGRVPFETGNLARSVLASTHGMPKTSLNQTQGGNVGAITATLKLDQAVWLGYQAVYARRMNYGFVGADKLGRVYNQEGRYFVEYAIEMWPTIVELAAEDIQANSKASSTATT